MGDKVKRVWREHEEPVGLHFLYGPLGMVEALFRCPDCKQDVEVDYGGEDLFYHCRCGAHLHLRFRPTLEELEPDA